jgi:hypothetical protein
LGAGSASNGFFAATPGVIPGMTRFQPENQNAKRLLNLIVEWIAQLG